MFVDQFYQIIPVSLRRIFQRALEASRKRQLKRLYSQFIKPGSLVFDIGANTGFYTECFLQLGADVVCVEPQPYCIDWLKRKFNDNPKVTIVEKGVAEKSGNIQLSMDSNNHATATFSEEYKNDGPFKNRTWDQKIEVPVVTLDDLIVLYGRPLYCKIDVEGYELNVLRGLSTPIPYISFEYSKFLLADAAKCLDYLMQLGDLELNFSISYNPAKLKLRKWTKSKEEILLKTKKSILGYTGDIFVKY